MSLAMTGGPSRSLRVPTEMRASSRNTPTKTNGARRTPQSARTAQGARERAAALPRHQAAVAATAPERPAELKLNDLFQGEGSVEPSKQSTREALRLLAEDGHAGVLDSAVVTPRGGSAKRTVANLDDEELMDAKALAKSIRLRVTRDRLERSLLSPDIRERRSSSASTSASSASGGSTKGKRATKTVSVKLNSKSLTASTPSASSKTKVAARKKKVAVKTTMKANSPEARASSWKQSSRKSRTQRTTLGLGNLAEGNAKGKVAAKADANSRRGDDHMFTFLSEIGNTGLLTKEQEVELATLAQASIKIEQQQLEIMKELGRLPSMFELSERLGVPVAELHERMHKGQLAKRLMVEHNVRLAVHVARHYLHNGVPLGDLVQEGLTGLVRALEKFDPKLGFRFSTYAHYWVRQGIVRAVSDQSRTIRLPAHVNDTLSKIRKARIELDDKSVDGPSDSAIALHLNLPEAKVTQVLNASRPLVDLDSSGYSDPNKDDKEFTKIDLLESDEEEHLMPENGCEMSLLLDDMEAALASLHPRERNILCMRYGLATADGTTMTLKDIGRAYGLTRERIRQIEEKALRKLRHPCCSVSLVEYLHVLTI